MSQSGTVPRSILALDCGSTFTRAFLLDQIEGEYALIARGQAPNSQRPPWNNLMASVKQATAQISETTGRQLLDEQGRTLTPRRPEGGLDAIRAIATAAGPLRLVLAGLTHPANLRAIRTAATLSHAVIEGIVSPGRQTGDVLSNDIEGQRQLIQRLEPDAILIVGGVDGGASAPVLDAARSMALACETLPTPPNARPSVIYAGNAELQGGIRGIFQGVTQAHIVQNLRPNVGTENLYPLQAMLSALHRQHKLESLPGFRALAEECDDQVLPWVRSQAHSLQFLARRDQLDVLGVEVGGAATFATRVIDGQVKHSTYTGLGLSHGASRFLDRVPLEAILRWLPFDIDPASARNSIQNKAVHPQTLPQTRQDLLLEHAMAREILRLATAQTEFPDGARPKAIASVPSQTAMVVGGGGVLANAPEVGQAALILLDGLQPQGFCRLALDCQGLSAALGAVARVNPQAAAQVMRRDALLELGTVIAPVGAARQDQVALTLSIEHAGGQTDATKVRYGSLQLIPLAQGQTASITLQASRHLDVGFGYGRSGSVQVKGGALGIIIDARGRPLPFAENLPDQQKRMRRWLRAVHS